MNKQIRNALKSAGHDQLFPIQEKTIEAFRSNDNVILLSKTGSGKTLAFLLSLINQLKESKPHTQAVILSPTRELCLQITSVFKSLRTNFTITTCYGGHSMQTERNNLSANPNIIVATPGRLCDHIRREHVKLSDVESITIDEFDKCLEMGFETDVTFIYEAISRPRYHCLTSATDLDEIPSFLNIRKPTIINEIEQQPELNITTYQVPIQDTEIDTLFDLLCSFHNEKAVVFTNYREVCEDVADQLSDLGLVSVSYHGGQDQEVRRRGLIKFEQGSTNILVCTDLGSRGLDIPDIKHVVHYQYPGSESAFTHRQGRTARNGESGAAYLFTDENKQLPEYVELPEKEYRLKTSQYVPVPEWETVYFSGGKKEKINKIDLVGFLFKKGQLKKDELGLIHVMDHQSYVAIKRDKVRPMLRKIRNEKVKGKKLRMAVSK